MKKFLVALCLLFSLDVMADNFTVYIEDIGYFDSGQYQTTPLAVCYFKAYNTTKSIVAINAARNFNVPCGSPIITVAIKTALQRTWAVDNMVLYVNGYLVPNGGK